MLKLLKIFFYLAHFLRKLSEDGAPSRLGEQAKRQTDAGIRQQSPPYEGGDEDSQEDGEAESQDDRCASGRESSQPAQIGAGQKKVPQEDETDQWNIHAFGQIYNTGGEFDVELVIKYKEN